MVVHDFRALEFLSFHHQLRKLVIARAGLAIFNVDHLLQPFKHGIRIWPKGFKGGNIRRHIVNLVEDRRYRISGSKLLIVS